MRRRIFPVRIITLTTDFGARDWFVGTMKGVIAGLNPEATIIDLTHEIPPGDIRTGAFALRASCRFFPKGTVHVVVIDPGVGSARKGIAVKTSRYAFVAPDNGVLSWALGRERIEAAHALENQAYFLHPVSQTFHGRDIFAPVAAHLSLGVSIQKLGPAQEVQRLAWPEPQQTQTGLHGEILYFDHFGNAITNIESATLKRLGSETLEVHRGVKRLCPVAAFYQAVPPGRPVAVPGSTGFLEIAVNGGSAAEALKLKVGTLVSVRTVH
jgi:S-adenosylmethionine hydrolase